MLEITGRASEFLEEARTIQGIPPTYGVRVFAEPSEEVQSAIQVGFSEGPAGGDEIVESQGTSLYVAPEINEALAEFVMDTVPAENGPSLVLKRR